MTLLARGLSWGGVFLSFFRETENDRILVVISFSEKPEAVTLALENDESFTEFFTGVGVHSENGLLRLSLKSFGYQLLTPHKKGSQ